MEQALELAYQEGSDLWRELRDFMDLTHHLEVYRDSPLVRGPFYESFDGEAPKAIDIAHNPWQRRHRLVTGCQLEIQGSLTAHSRMGLDHPKIFQVDG